MKEKKMVATAKVDYEFSSIEKWTKGKRYNLVHDPDANNFELEADDNYIGNWSEAAFNDIEMFFDIVEELKPGHHWECKYCDGTTPVQSPYEKKGFMVCLHCGAEWEDCKIQVKDEEHYDY